MEKMDLVIKNGTVVTAGQCLRLDIAIKDQKIAALLNPDAQVDSMELIDATGLVVMPGCVDIHSHIWEPTQYEYREDFYSGTCAAAAGGITTIVEMPLSVPPVFDKNSFDYRLQRARSKCVVDFAFWGSFISEAFERFEELEACGCVAYKAFLSYANPQYPSVDDFALLKGMERLAGIGGLLGAHAENTSITEGYAKEFREKKLYGGEYHEKSRPVISELEAIQKLILFAKETSCRIHICHLSSAAAIELIDRAKQEGVQVTVETCPHYLTLSIEDLKRCNGFAKCNPPLRTIENQEALWELIGKGRIDCIGSDHTTYTDDDRQQHGENIWDMPAGIGGFELFLPLLIDQGYHKHSLPLQAIAKLTAENPARILGLSHCKGRIETGADADFAFVDLNREWVYNAKIGLSKAKCQNGPYEGRIVKGKVVRTMVRGFTVFQDDAIKIQGGVGRFVEKGR